ncbi:MAG: SIMPL domain-containing protein [Xanthobacteraceae bacterium]|jgi:hypothetical protein
MNAMIAAVYALFAAVMATMRRAARVAVATKSRRFSSGAAVLAAAAFAAGVFMTTLSAQAQQSQLPPERSVIVIGEGSVSLPPDYARVRGGVTTRAKTAKEATEANTKAMAAITAMLLNAGTAQNDIQTSRFSVQPIYESHQSGTEQRLSGFSVSNQVNITIRQIDKVGEILDRLVTTGATDVGNVEFLHSDPSKALDQAREAAVADARRKAELYAHASGLTLGGVSWITEDSRYAAPMPMTALRASAAMASVPIATGEDTLHVRITVGFDMTH